MTAILEHPDHTSTVREAGYIGSPLAFAYMRVPCDIPDYKVLRMKLEFRASAERKGLCLSAIFCEYVCGAGGVFDDMVSELRRTGAHHVLVPTYRHLARNQLLQNSLLLRLELDADAEVFELVDTDR